ncbi:hypothetical protein MTO96_040171 [Rhipicephalus appendiculatus]
MKSTKKANRGKKARWPDLECSLRTWVLQQRAEGRGLSTVQLRLKAKDLAAETNAVGFNGGPSWCFRFMRRNQLVMRAHTTVCQKLPDDFQAQLERFSSFVREEVAKNNVSASHIVNMDEVPLTFDIPLGRSVTEKCQKTVTVRTTGHKKSHFTVVLACCADGTKLPPMLIFKRKTLPKDIFPPTVVIQANTKGWMDEEMMGVWLDHCFSRRPDGFFHVKPGMLVMDSMRAYITDIVKKKIGSKNCMPVIIPGRMTKILQPLDISVNRSFKAVLRRLWESWMSEGEHSFTKTGRTRCAEFGEVAKWVSEAWNSISDKTIAAGFRKAGLIPCVADVEESDSSESEDDSDAPGLQPEIAALFVSDSEEDDFDGFE